MLFDRRDALSRPQESEIGSVDMANESLPTLNQWKSQMHKIQNQKRKLQSNAPHPVPDAQQPSSSRTVPSALPPSYNSVVPSAPPPSYNSAVPSAPPPSYNSDDSEEEYKLSICTDNDVHRVARLFFLCFKVAGHKRY